MSTQPLGSPRVRFFDANGDPLIFGKLYTYSAGTSTPLSTYTTHAGNVANTNPVVLDSEGYADVWMTPGVNYKFVLKNSVDTILWTLDNFPSPAALTSSTDAASLEPGGRLTLTSGTPVTTSDVTGATTIYYVPYKSSKVPLYDGTNWALYDISTGLSQTTADTTHSPAAVAASSLYDLFVWNDSGTLRLSRGPAWTSALARGTGAGTTEIEQVNGRYVNKVSITNGPSAHCGLYVGTVSSDGSSQINDSLVKRHVWNNNNRVPRAMRRLEASTWAYSTGAWRQANGSASNQLAFVRGLDEDAVSARVVTDFFDNGGAGQAAVGIGLDAANALAAACVNTSGFTTTANVLTGLTASWEGLPGLGSHALTWIEYSLAHTTNTFFVGNNGPNIQSGGIMGQMLA